MALELTTIAALTPLIENDLKPQVDLGSRVLADKVIPVEQIGSERRVIDPTPGVVRVGTVVGGAAYPAADAISSNQLIPLPVTKWSHCSIPIPEAMLVNGKQNKVNLIKKHLLFSFNSMNQDQGSNLFDGYVAAVESGAAIAGGSTATLSLTSITRIKPGQTYDFYTVANVLDGSCKAGAITRDGDGSGTVAVSLITDGINGNGSARTSGTIAVGSYLVLAGSKSPAAVSPAQQNFHTLVDFAGSGTLYGTAVTDSDWSGNSVDVAGSEFDKNQLRELCDDIGQRSGGEPENFIMGRLVFEDYEEGEVGNRRYLGGDTLDPYGKIKPQFRDKPITVDNNCPHDKVFALGKDAVSRLVWQEPKTLSNGGANAAAEVSASVSSFLLRTFSMSQMCVDRRNAVGMLKNIAIDRPGS